MKRFMVVNEVRLFLYIEAEDANHAVRKARDTSLDEWEIGDTDRIEVYDDDGNDADFSWDAVEALA